MGTRLDLHVVFSYLIINSNSDIKILFLFFYCFRICIQILVGQTLYCFLEDAIYIYLM